MFGPHDCLGRGAPAWDSQDLRRLLQRGADTLDFEQGGRSELQMLSDGQRHRRSTDSRWNFPLRSRRWRMPMRDWAVTTRRSPC
jgi:hypothetical protein